MANEREDVCFWAHPDDANRILAEWTRPGGGGDSPDDPPPPEARLPSRDTTERERRAALEAHLARDANRAEGGIEVVAVLVVDIDDFQDVTDLYGKHVSDATLGVVAERLTAVRGATAFHLDAHMFVVIADALRSAFDALAVARRVHRRISQPIVVEGCEVALSASIGVRVSLDGARDPAELVLDAGFALEEAKRRGRGESVLFSVELRDRLLHRRRESRDDPASP
jgi:diguanylate cyclase (GGDEF)-like protein